MPVKVQEDISPIEAVLWSKSGKSWVLRKIIRENTASTWKRVHPGKVPYVYQECFGVLSCCCFRVISSNGTCFLLSKAFPMRVESHALLGLGSFVHINTCTWNHRITERLRLEGLLEAELVPMFCVFHYERQHQLKVSSMKQNKVQLPLFCTVYRIIPAVSSD